MNPIDMSLDDIITSSKKQRSTAQKQKAPRSKTQKKESNHPFNEPKQKLPVSAKIIISNLASGVTQKDLTDLFGRVGPIKSASLNYDSNGKSKGNGVVLFGSAADAQKAIREYHDRTFDGKPMKLELVVSAGAAGGLSLSNRLGAVKPKQQANKKETTATAKPKKGKKKGTKKVAKTGEELDADMDSYMKDE